MKLVYILVVLFFENLTVYASLCEQYNPPKQIGSLDKNIVKEASGLAVSKNYPDRLYHVNDSGDGPFFYITDFKGKHLEKIEVEGVKFEDVEDLGYGPCGDQTCLYIADIGDNDQKRKSLKLFLIEEKEQFAAKVLTKKIIKFKYPDGPHNAESFAVHPNGDVFIITKNTKLFGRSAAKVTIFKLSKEEIENDDQIKVMKRVGVIDFTKVLYYYDFLGRLVTSFDFSPDGSKFIVLTYKAAVEFNNNLATETLPLFDAMKPNKDYHILDLTSLPQQESIAYLASGNGFIYNTEYKKRYGEIPLIQIDCAQNL